MSRIVVIGGHGKVALLLTPILAELGHSVTSVIRNPDHAADVEAAGAIPHVADVEMLEDLIVVAVADAQKRAAEVQQAEMGRITGGMDLPFQLPF